MPRVCQCCVGEGGTARAAEGSTDSFWSLFQRLWHPLPGTKTMEGHIGWPVKSGSETEEVLCFPCKVGILSSTSVHKMETEVTQVSNRPHTALESRAMLRSFFVSVLLSGCKSVSK